MTEIDYASRVARGIALMDEKWPNWAAEIDLDTLDIEDGSACMTAQYAKRYDSYANFSRGQDLLGLSDSAYEAHGFNAEGQSTDKAAEPDPMGYATLNGLWRAEIIRRREAAQSEASEQ